jgi:hypothetical protein
MHPRWITRNLLVGLEPSKRPARTTLQNPSSLELSVHYARTLNLVGLTSADLTLNLLLRHGR